MTQDKRRAAYLAFDERSKKVVAYDAQRKFIGVHTPRVRAKRQGPSCSLVSQSVLKRMDSYIKLEDQAIALWGDGWNKTLTNDPDYPDSPASVCVSEDPQTVTLDAQPSCSSSTSSSNSIVAQSAGDTSLSYKRGTTTGVHLVITQAAIFPEADVDIAAQLQMPALAADGDTFPAAFTVHNQQTQTADVTKDTLTDETVQASASAAGQTCSLALTNSTCSASGTGRMQVYATGWLWINYNEVRQGHYKWAVSIDDILPNINDRSSWIEYKTAFQSWSVTKATPSCAFVAGDGGTTSEGSSKGGTSTAVIIALPVSLASIAIILGAVAFFLWRRRRSRNRQTDDSTVTSSMRPQIGSYPDVSPMILPPPSSAPPSESLGRSLSSAKGHALLAGGKRQSGATRPEEFTSGSYDRRSMIESEVLPPAYSESAAPASTSGSYSYAGSSTGPR